MKLWDELTPWLYRMDITLEDETGVKDHRTEVFGMREFTVSGLRFAINGIPVFLRGTTGILIREGHCSFQPCPGK